MLRLFFTALCCLSVYTSYSQTFVLDSLNKEPISFAAISFGDGNGTFADDEGKFYFTKKLYADIDTIYVSSLGYNEKTVLVNNLKDTLLLNPKVDRLDEVFLSVILDRDFEEETLKPYLDDDYYKCWLPTVESEIAVFFPNSTENDKQLTAVHFPIALESKDWEKRKKANSEKKPFSTLFKANFYAVNNGKPGKNLLQENVVFRVTEKDGDVHNLDVSKYKIYIPSDGIFISLQVLGYTDKKGKLLPNKKYKEIKGRNGIVKIPTNFRPLLPFTDEIENNRTYIKRVFIHNNSWKLFSEENVFKSTLLKAGLNNYGVGISYKEFKDE